MQEHLVHSHGGYFAFGELYRPTLGSDARARVSVRLRRALLVDLSASRFVLPDAKSSFCLMASASRELLDSILSIVFAPSSGTRNIIIRQLAQYLLPKRRLSNTIILDMTTYQSRSVIVIKHMFVVLRLKQGHREGWLRLHRRAEDPFSVSFISSGMGGPAKDEVCHIVFS